MIRKRLNDSKDIDYTIRKGFQFIEDNPRIIQGIYKQVSYNDEPKLYGYTIHFKDKYGNVKNEDAVGGGVSFDIKKALLKALGEVVERYSLSTNNDKKFFYQSLSDLTSLDKSAINLKDLILFSDKKRDTADLDKQKFHWVEGKSLISNKKVLVPAQLVYVPYVYEGSEMTLRFPISTGAAAGMSLTGALYRGICEVVERDAFMISYLNKIPSPQVDLSAIKDKSIDDIASMFKKYKLELVVLDLTNDLEIPTFSAIILDRTGVGPAVSVGLKAGFNSRETIIGAIEESVMVRSWTRDEFAYAHSHYKARKVIRTIEDRAYFWFRLSCIKYLDFWLKNKALKRIHIENFKHIDSSLEQLVKLLNKKNIEIIYVDITDKVVRKYDFVVVKVVIPQLQPLYLDERYPYLKGDRLYSVPVRMGFLQKSKTRNELNKTPHPFL